MRLRSSLLAVIFAATLVPSLAARADEDPVARAREEFTEGVSLMAANDWAGALKKFKDVGRVKMNANVAFNMAECEDHLGLLVQALGDYRLASAKAQDGSAPKVAEQVDERISAIEKRIGHVTIERTEPKPNPAATLQLDGLDVPPGEVGKSIAVNPGTRVLAVVVNGRSVRTEKIDIEEGATKAVKIAIPEPAEGDVSVGGEPVVEKKGPSIPGIVLSTVGGASLVTGLVFVGLRQKEIGDLNKVCTVSGSAHTCPKSAQSTYDTGRTYTGVAEVMIPVGAVALVTGVILVATHGKKAPKDAAPAQGASLNWSPSAPNADLAGASLVGRF